MSQKKQDLVILLILTIVAIVLSLSFGTNFLTSAILFLGLPSLFLFYRQRAQSKKILLAAVTFGLLGGFVFDFIAELNKAWDWHGGLLFGKLLGIVQVDVIIWFFLWMLYIILFYEHFINKQKPKLEISRRALTVFGCIIASVLLLLTVYWLSPDALYIDKAYLILGIVVCAPSLLVLIKKPRLLLATAPMIGYFFFVYLSYEITALHLNQWQFPGDYLALVTIFNVSFPIEELIFWIILSSPLSAAYYAVTFNGQKK